MKTSKFGSLLYLFITILMIGAFIFGYRLFTEIQAADILKANDQYFSTPQNESPTYTAWMNAYREMKKEDFAPTGYFAGSYVLGNPDEDDFYISFIINNAFHPTNHLYRVKMDLTTHFHGKEFKQSYTGEATYEIVGHVIMVHDITTKYPGLFIKSGMAFSMPAEDTIEFVNVDDTANDKKLILHRMKDFDKWETQ
jgi:hypothetical protein